MSGQSYKYIFKAILIGDTGVGKSCLLLQLIENEIRKNHDVTIGVEFGAKVMKSQGENIKLQIWDTAGQENFRSITRSYYRSAAAAILVYDVTSVDSFINIKTWMDEIEEQGNQHTVLILVGNKKDQEDKRQVPTQDAQQFADTNNIPFLETSALTGENVNKVFLDVIEIIQNKINTKQINLNEDVLGIKHGNSNYARAETFAIDDPNYKSEKKKKCC